MAFIADESILEVKRSADITEIVRGYLPALKKAGANYKACCPFHDEKTPSFNVHPEKQIYKCFGCGKAGDAISFVMEIEKADYPEAIRILAEKSGIPLKYKELPGRDSGPRKEDLYRVNEWAAGVFRSLLATDPASAARAYLAKRGVTAETEETFRLGYAPDEWEGLLSRARKAGFDDRLMLAAGLAVERDGGGGCYDRFRGRLIFPIWDVRGKVIGFGARALGDEHPKYINTNETGLFSKGRNFYGLHLQKEALEETRTVHIVEGYFDVILPYQSGVKAVVATLGTALTRDHLKLLRRYVDRVVLVFDGDAAGQKANERGLDMLLGENADVFVASLPQDEDPCDVVVRHGADALRQSLAKPREIFDFLLDALGRRHGTETPAAKGRVIDEILERVAQIDDPVKAELLLKQTGARFGIDERTLRSKARRKGPAPALPTEPADAAESGAASDESVGRELLAILASRPEFGAVIRQAIPCERFPGAVSRRVAAKAYARPECTGGEILALLEDGAERTLLAGALEMDMDLKAAEKRLAHCLEFVGIKDFQSAWTSLRSAVQGAKSPEEQNRFVLEVIQRRRQQPNITRSMPRP